MAKSEKKPKLVTGGGTGPMNVNQKAPIFNDRRTKRNRDRSSQNRNAIKDSSNG
jgi:hypothetical protein